MAGSGSTSGADLLVVGLGAMGAATTLRARRLGLSVIGVDRHRPPHNLGSTHAETRITRLAVGEGPHYLPFVRRSHELWRELEAETGRRLLWETGGLILTEPTADTAPSAAATGDVNTTSIPPAVPGPASGSAPEPGERWDDFAVRTHAIGVEAGVPVSLLRADEVAARCPVIRPPEGASVAHEPTAGLVACERAVAVQLDLARAAGADVRLEETVLSVEPDEHGVDVTTDRGRYRADHVVLAAGAWLAAPDRPGMDPGGPTTDGRLLAPAQDAASLTVTRQVVFWFEADEPAAFTVDAIPFVMWVGSTIDDYLAVFPSPPGMTGGVKVLGEQFAVTTDPDTVDRRVSADEIAAFHARNVAPRVPGLTDRCVRAEICLYTNTPDDHFLIDTAPGSHRVTVVSACSGHGFKHSAAIGEALAQRLATGTSDLDLSPFARR